MQLVNRPDGTLALHWKREGIFWVRPRQRQVQYRSAPRVAPEVFQDTLVGPLLSFLLLLEGRHPLHGSVLQFDGAATAFLGQPGAGKSTIAAAGLLAGWRLVVDDVLAIRWQAGRPYALPGHPEIRLWPSSGRRLIPHFNRLPRVVPTTSKRRVDPRDYPGGFAQEPVPLRAVYELRRSAGVSHPTIRPLTPREGCLALVRNLYNTALVRSDTLQQQFWAMGRLASAVPVRQLILPRRATDPRRLPSLIHRDWATLSG